MPQKTLHHAINIISGAAIVYSGLTAILCIVNYIALPVFIVGVLTYLLNNEKTRGPQNAIYNTRRRG